MTDLRKYARGKPCQVRLPEICNGDDSTTVLAHIRLSGITGVGMKAPDVMGAWACSACHAEVDRRSQRFESDFVRIAFYDGVMRTQAQLVRDKVVNW